VVETATADEIHAAYKRLARRVHPDAGGDERRMATVNEAYRVLCDAGRRAAYDRARRVPSGDALPHGAAARGVAELDDDVDFVPMAPWQRRLPVWAILVLGSLFAVFLLTAYAGSGRGGSPGTSVPPVDGAIELNSCVHEDAGGVVREVSCSVRHDGVVMSLIRVGERCPVSTYGYRRADVSDGYACVRRG
jgi:hypothetical protein